MLIMNGVQVENVIYNGQDLDKLIYNNVIVFEKSGFDAEKILIDFEYERNSDSTYTIIDWKGTYQGYESTECIIPNKKEIRLYSKTITSSIENYYEIQYAKNLDLDFQIYGFTNKEFEDLKVEVSISNQDSCVYNEYTLTTIDEMQTNLTIKLQGGTVPGTSNVKITITSGKHIYSKNLTFKVLEWVVESVPGVRHGFSLQPNGFYISENKGVSASYALCKITIINPEKKNVYFDCINYAQTIYDYGYLSKVDTPFKTSGYDKDDSSLIYYDFYQKHSPDIVTVNYGPIEGTIYAKYIKDWDYSYGSHYNYDSFQFKIRIE